MKNLKIFLPLRFGNFGVSKTAFLTFLVAQNLQNLGLSKVLKCGDLPKTKIQDFQNYEKCRFQFLKLSNLISRKI